jgi:hypothetical protein
MTRMNRASDRVIFLATAVAGLAALTGCPPTPPPEAVLEGTWEMTTTESTDLTQLLLTFDAQGDLSRITYQLDGGTILIATSPTAATNVNGDDVSISVTFSSNALVFNGKFNNAKTVITGTTTTYITVGLFVVQINNGPAVLTKQ